MSDDMDQGQRQGPQGPIGQGQPPHWSYSWLGGMPVESVVQPTARFEGTWQEALADLAGRAHAEAAPSPLHEHTAACWGDDSEAIMDNLEGVGWVCNATARYATQFGENEAGARIVLRYDPWVWYPMDVVERTRG